MALDYQGIARAQERHEFHEFFTTDAQRLAQICWHTAKSVGWTAFVVAQISKSAVSPVSKPACCGYAKTLPSVPIVRYCPFLVL
jgi:hypothetical protein